MHTSPTSASANLPKTDDEASRPHRLEDVVYQSVTVAAIILLLGSIWVF
jgi:hypothetical protein